MQDFLILTTFISGFWLFLSGSEAVIGLIFRVFPAVKAKFDRFFKD